MMTLLFVIIRGVRVLLTVLLYISEGRTARIGLFAISEAESPTTMMFRLFVLAATLGVGFVFTRMFQERMRFRRLQKQEVPMMPHSLLFGHLRILMNLTSHLPKDIHFNYVPQAIADNWETLFPGRKSCPSVIYADMWPMGPPLIFTIHPEAAGHFMCDSSVPRSDWTRKALAPITEAMDLASMVGGQWKTWRARFNPSFSNKNVLGLVPGMLEDVEIFTDIVRQRVGAEGSWGGVFPLVEITTNLTMDIIGRAVLNIELHEQINGPSRFRSALVDQIARCMLHLNIITVWKWYSPWRLAAIKRNRETMHSELLPSIERSLNGTEKKDGLKTIIDLALKSVSGVVDVDQLFIETVVSHLKLFMFAGHDTTATALCWALHCIAKNPEVGQRLRAEHDEVFGKDPADAMDKIRESPHLLNSLIYTGGVIKEALRLFTGPPVVRDGLPHYRITDSITGEQYPTGGFLIWDGLRSQSRNDDLWPRAKEVVPERWMTTDPKDPLYPKKHGWRTFGLGSRACIGQELAVVEMKLVLVSLARNFDIDCAWDEWDALK
ncbi:cytochrome P450 4V3 [Colletotrichum orchidophilum]|uniref:Cytochrome P450 4V3 n=1 Tax=Colletotrichum orchidophilum TaxID=1209926 RepID=A0A1G4BSG0_9PEZI|nr:cytochrome P450 4V3 [Colletotrichum orchidophilum]OHF04265.1 cytochrome P450 4V3 [Colletotrichum orchidophilum]